MKDPIKKAIEEYENIMQIKLSEVQRLLFIAGYQFALIDHKLMSCQKEGKG